MEQKLLATFKEENLLEICALLADCIWDWDDSRFTRAEYATSFREYSERFSPTFLTLQQVCAQRSEEAEWLLEKVCHGATTQVAERLSAIRGRNDRLMRQDMCKMVAVVYFTPAVGELAMPVGASLAQMMCEAWARRFPKDRYALVSYDEIIKGFNRKWYQCYITQAVCEQFGFSDDCDELQMLRAFRDGYLCACPDGPELIDEYYRYAPKLVCRIWASSEKKQIYEAIWNRYLQPCLHDIECGNMKLCKSRYEKMVRVLQQRFLPWEQEDSITPEDET